MTPAQVAQLIVRTLDDKKAKDVTVLKTDSVTIIADYFIICTATSTTHVKSLADEVDKILSEAGEPPRRREGYRSGGWLLLDFGCAVLHIFMADTRKFYDLERLWSDAERIDVETMLQDKAE